MMSTIVWLSVAEWKLARHHVGCVSACLRRSEAFSTCHGGWSQAAYLPVCSQLGMSQAECRQWMLLVVTAQVGEKGMSEPLGASFGQ
jgi:hypothetical protein